VLLFSALAAIVSAQQQQVVTQANIEDDIKSFVCKNDERLDAAKTLFRNAGAEESDMSVVSAGKVHNLVIVKKGESDETIIVGAHYDKVSAGCGVIDNWTGIVIIANLYKYLLHFKSKKTFLFIAFDREEEGLVGSNAFASAIPKEKRSQYCSMVNFDSFGFGYPQVMTNTTTPSLEEFAKKLAIQVNMPLYEAGISNADADSDSFKMKGIPAITLHGLSNDWQHYLHTSNDNIKNVKVGSVYVGFNFGALLLSNLDAQPCDAFWPKSGKKKESK
jgi:Zn-dependent M28 family amino/carboxypeptidase